MADRTDPTVFRDGHVRVEGDIVAIEVGRTKRLFYVHDKLLRKRSTFYQEVLDRSSAATKRVAIPEVKVTTFELYVQYIYSGRLPCKKLDPCGADYGELIELYLAAQKMKDPRAMDTVVNAMLVLYTPETEDHSGTMPSSESIWKVYHSTSSGSKLRKLFVDMVLREANHDRIEEIPDHHPEFLADVAKAALMQIKATSNKEGLSAYEDSSCCDYHEHTKTATCFNRKCKREDSDDEASDDEESEADSLNPARTANLLQRQIKKLQSVLAASTTS